MRQKSARPQSSKKKPAARLELQLLDRARLALQFRNYKAGRVDLHDPDPNGSMLTGHAPDHFHVMAKFERSGPWLWIGIDPAPNDTEGRICFAIIKGEQLRKLAEGVLRYYPAGKTGGAR